MTDEDDWFERALTENEEREEGEGAAESDGDGDGERDGADGGERSGDAGGDEQRTGGSVGDRPSETDETDDGASSDATAAGEADDTSEDGSDAGGDAGLFEDDFANVDAAAAGDSGGPFASSDDGPFAGGDDGQIDGGSFGGGEVGAFGSGGGDVGIGDFGMGASGERTDFSDEAVDSDIERIDLGIDGLDDMIRGGVPERSLMATIGSAGTGKTTFGLQFLEEGLSNDEKGIYVTLEESRERVLRSAEEKGWSFDAYAAEDQLAVVDIDPIEMANSLSSIRNELPRLVDQFGATRLVLDSVSLLEMMYDDRATRRNEIYTFARSLKESGVTVLLTSEADEDNPYASRHGIVEYLTDAVYVLQYVRPSDFQETRLAVEIQKIRDAHHSREMKPFEITDDGLNVYRRANIF